MKARLLQDSRREGKAGDTVEVSPERLAFLESIGAAVKVTEAREQAEEPAKPAEKKAAEKKTAAKKPAAKKTK